MNDELDELSERQHAVVARRQCRDLGLGKSATYHLWHRSPLWEPLSREVIRRVGSPRTDAQQLMAAALDAAGDARASYLTGARWWGHEGCTLRPFVFVSGQRSRRVPTLGILHRGIEFETDWVTTLDGIPIVRPEMLSMQVFDVCRYERGERIVEWLWAQRLLSGPSIHRFLDELGERGRNGTAGLREYLRTRPPGYVPAASGLESRAMQLFAEAGIPMRRQVDVGADHWTGRVDFLHEHEPLVVEIQSERYHRALVDVIADARRRKQLEADGFEVVELTDDDVWTRPSLVALKTESKLDEMRSS